jgi:hypothetical protein
MMLGHRASLSMTTTMVMMMMMMMMTMIGHVVRVGRCHGLKRRFSFCDVHFNLVKLQ